MIFAHEDIFSEQKFSCCIMQFGLYLMSDLKRTIQIMDGVLYYRELAVGYTILLYLTTYSLFRSLSDCLPKVSITPPSLYKTMY